MVISIITFNILASRFTNFSRGDNNNPETNSDMELRYNVILKVLKHYMDKAIDFICLQEVDYIFYKLLRVQNFKTYKISYTAENMKVWNPKSVYGMLILYNTSKYNFIKKQIQNITPLKFLQENTLYSTKRSKQSLDVYLKNKKNKTICVSTTHLSGQPDRNDIRIGELDKLINNMDKSDIKLITGDFNERNPKMFLDTIYNNKLDVYNKHFMKKKFATSYHPWNINRETKVMYKEPEKHLYSKVDYLIHSETLKVINTTFMPDDETGILNHEVPYKSPIDYKKDLWPSDHALLYFELDYK